MSILKSLSFTAFTKARHSPVQNRRAQLVARLEDQKALLADPAFVRTVKRWRTEDGQKVQVDHRVKVQPWWASDERGQTVLTVRHGLRHLEFEKGKPGILVGPKEKLAGVIDTLISAARAGELDGFLEQAKAARPVPKKKAA